ncbi:hypothetical protein Ahy_A09g043685 [Arachis hypogaea]|uniref:Uncharacterized protein n=1 Tax=Arachis hypogaea TaxID=3818 RepID=A0A445BIU6_ARAHY|nr:hypothetical protein Ahy_A09g043685 [Arachis hypogaea]
MEGNAPGRPLSPSGEGGGVTKRESSVRKEKRDCERETESSRVKEGEEGCSQPLLRVCRQRSIVGVAAVNYFSYCPGKPMSLFNTPALPSLFVDETIIGDSVDDNKELLELLLLLVWYEQLGFHLYALSSCFFSNGLVPLEKADSHVKPLSSAQSHPWWLKVKEAISIANNACWSIGELVVKIQKKKIKKNSDMNVYHLKPVGNGYSSSNSSSSIPYLANGGIPSLKLPVVVVLWPFS